VIHAKGYIPNPAGHMKTSFRLLRGQVAAAYPSAATLEQFYPPRMDQNRTSSCIGHGSSGAAYTSLWSKGQKLSFVPSPKGWYDVARCIDRADPSVLLTDDGAMPNSAMRGSTEWGIRAIKAPTSQGYYSDCEPSTINDEPTLDELAQEAQFKLIGWYGITDTGKQRIDDLCSAIYAGWAVGDGSFVDTGFENWKAGDPAYGAADLNDPNGGGHWEFYGAYRTAASSKKEFQLVGSWGSDDSVWGFNGTIWVTEEFVQQATDLDVFAVRKA